MAPARAKVLTISAPMRRSETGAPARRASPPTSGSPTTVASTHVGSTGEDAVTSGGNSTGGDASATGDATTGLTSATGGTTGASSAATEAGSTGEPGESEGSTGEAPLCPLALMHVPCDEASDDPLHAIGLNCSALGGQWVDKLNAVAVTGLEFVAAPEQGERRPWQVARAYGTHVDPDTQAPFWSAREGDRVLLLSSGLLPGPDAQGVVIVPGGEVYNDVGAGKWDDEAVMGELRQHIREEWADPDGVVIIDPSGFVTSWNSGATRMEGYTPSDVLGKHFSHFYTSEDVRESKPWQHLLWSG